MKDILVPIDKAGRVVLPKNVREELAIEPGDVLKVSIHGDAVTLRPSRERAGFIKRGRALIFSSGQTGLLDNEAVNSILAGERESLGAGIAKRLPPQKRK